MNMLFKSSLLSLIASGVLLTGCANNQIANTDILSQQAKEQAINSTLSPQEAILNSAKLIEESQNAELHFYAPLHYKEAQEALTDAQNLLNSKAENTLILEQTFKVDRLLKAAYSNKKTVLSTLNKALSHKQVLEELGTPETLPEAYQDSIDDLKDLIKEIEGGFIDKALKGQAKLLSAMTEVEISTLKKQHLSAVESMIDKAESIDADEFAEKTFDQAEQALKSATVFIEKNYKDREAVRKNSLDALNAASHAYHIAKEASELVELKRADAEKKALYFESLLERINKTIGIENLNTMSLYDQSVLMAKKVEALKQSMPNTSAQVSTPALTETLEIKPVENTTKSATNSETESLELNNEAVIDVRPIQDDHTESETSTSNQPEALEQAN